MQKATRFGRCFHITYHPYSDFALHHMGSTLADGTSQGVAQPDEFRTAPLWGLGQRLFFMHDGRARDLGAAIAGHVGPGNTCVTTQDYQQFNANGVWFQPFVQTQTCAGDANQVIARFDRPERDAAAGSLELLALAVAGDRAGSRVHPPIQGMDPRSSSA
jgi:hypothetical protein